MNPSTIGGINKLDEAEKRAIYARYIPQDLMQRFNLHGLADIPELLQFRFASGASDVEMSLYHEPGFPEPILYAHLTDTMNGQIHVLLYILNDPASPRFDVDKMPEGSPTRFGIMKRNLQAELAVMQAGLSPGQVRRGFRLARPASEAFVEFVISLGHDIFFVEPLFRSS